MYDAGVDGGVSGAFGERVLCVVEISVVICVCGERINRCVF